MTLQFDRSREFLAGNRNVKITEIKDYEIKTPLQKAVQILKRHRDIMFGNDEDKPISIIITTLAAKAYNNEDNIVNALENILLKMPLYLERIDGITWVRNPINRIENFADRWEENPSKEKNFREWIIEANIDLVEIVRKKTVNEAGIFLRKALGSNLVNSSLKKAGLM